MGARPVTVCHLCGHPKREHGSEDGDPGCRREHCACADYWNGKPERPEPIERDMIPGEDY